MVAPSGFSGVHVTPNCGALDRPPVTLQDLAGDALRRFLRVEFAHVEAALGVERGELLAQAAVRSAE